MGSVELLDLAPQSNFNPWWQLALQSRMGLVAYLLLWAVVVVPTGFYREFPTFTAINTALILLNIVWRVFSLYRFKDYLEQSPARTKTLLTIGVYWSGFHWGVLGAFLLWNPEYESIKLIFLLCLTGINAVCVTFSFSSISFTFGFYAISLPPIMIASAAMRSGEGVSLFFVILGYWGCLMWLGKNLHALHARAHKTANLAERKAIKYAEISHLDSLTQIKNRHYFEEHYPRQWALAFRQQQPISLLIIDVDYFKQINDQYGHLVGDDCLLKVADAIKQSTRQSVDGICRYGGDEFVFVLPETDSSDAEAIAARLVDSVRQITFDDHPNLSMSLSIGVCSVIPDDVDGYMACLDNADTALYTAKKAGRNCFRRYTDN